VLRGAYRLRAGAMLLAGAAVVHEGRVLAEGHGGLVRSPHDAVPLFLATAGVVTLFALAQLLRAPAATVLPSLRRLWLGAAASLVAIHLVQETLEGGVHQALSPATLVAVACALVVAALVAFALREAERLIAATTGSEERPLGPSPTIRRGARRRAFPRDLVARHLAGRAPPAAG
jgi:hypothetical protein